MPAEISPVDLGIIRNMMLTSSHREIASLLELSVDEVKTHIDSLIEGTGLYTHQMKLDEGKRARKLFTHPKIEESKRIDIQPESIQIPQPIKNRNLKSDPNIRKLIERTNQEYETKVTERPPAEYGNPDWTKMYLDNEL